MDALVRLLTTIIGVLAAVGAFTAAWVGLNLLFSQSARNFARFSAILGALAGGIGFAIIDGNRLVKGLTERPATLFNGDEPGLFTNGLFDGLILGHLLWPVVGALIGGAVGYGLAQLDDRSKRLIFGVVSGVVIGLIIGLALKTRYQLALKLNPLLTYPIVFAALGAAWGQWRSRKPLPAALSAAAVGLLLGTFGSAAMGTSAANLPETLLATCGIAALAGARLGITKNPDVNEANAIETRSRAVLFVGPAILSVVATLIIPIIGTFVLSFRDRDDEIWVGGQNYSDIVTNPTNFDTANWGSFFGSNLLWVGLLFLVLGLILAFLLGKETGTNFSTVGPPLFPLVLGGTILLFGVFTHLRGTIVNNIWWVVGVTTLSTALGLAVAKFADNRSGESVAKSLVFMPMAISMVGASIIWRLMMYQPRDASKSQTGTLNAIWVWLGEVTAPGTTGQWVFAVIFFGTVVALLYLAYRTLGKSITQAGFYMVVAIIPLWVAVRTVTDGIGGYIIQSDGGRVPLPVDFVSDGPFNNFFLMLIMVWIQTGFAMVILSAAIKAVPDDLLEAARIDGADESQIFWRITIPQILPTITVVGTTIMVNVMKVFDIVKVTTNGQFGSEVLANAMIREAFTNFNRGLGAALAIVLFVGILPIVVMNLSRMIKEA